MHALQSQFSWRLQFQCIKSISLFSGVCGLKGQQFVKN